MERYATILLSRQTLCPTGNSPWVRQSALAVKWIKERGYRLISSVGIPTWELVTALGSIHQVPIRLLIAEDMNRHHSPTTFVFSQFSLRPDLASLEVLSEPDTSHNKTLRMHRRDKAIVDTADLILPISISPEGGMARLVEEAVAGGKEICRDFETPYAHRAVSIAYRVLPGEMKPELRTVGDKYITHWTRSCHAPWPDENPLEYYRDIINSVEYPRGAFETLRHIVATGELRASSRHMPANIPCVSFSNSSPEELLPLMRWRARYRQMSFEPYGIGIRREAALKAGIKPVRYVERPGGEVDAGEGPWLQQSRGRKTDWRQEREFRHRGDFALGQLPLDDLILFCRTTKEAEQLRQSFGLKVVPFVV